MRIDRRAVHLLAAWTVLVWATRLRNVLDDPALDAGATAWRVAWIVVFVVLALVSVVAVRRRSATAPGLLRVFGVWSVAFWVVRSVQIAGADHAAAFVAVHLVLAVVSIALAVWAWPRRDRRVLAV